MHWSLFYYLKQEGVIQEAYPTQLIQAEFPTLKTFPAARGYSRGYYDLVVLDPETYNSPVVQAMNSQTPWNEFLRQVKITIDIRN